MIDFDHNSTTRLDAEVLDAMMPYLTERYFNPSSGHAGAKQVRAAIEEARGQVADLLGGRAEEVLFTSGATESINTVLATAVRSGKGVISSNVEHSAAFEPLEKFAAEGAEVAWIGVGDDGLVDQAALAQQLGEGGYGLVNLIWANNETGVVQKVDELCQLVHDAGAALHLDAVQAAGKMDLSGHAADYLSISGHKINGPKGVGALLVRGGHALNPFIIGGGQEAKRRGGTENVASVIGLGKACELAGKRIAEGVWQGVQGLRDQLQSGLQSAISGLRVNGASAPRIPNTLSVTIPGCQAEGLLILLEERGVIAAAGSACSTGKIAPSRVLTAMGLDRASAKSTIRLSLGHETTEEEVQTALKVIPEAVERLRSVQSSIAGPVVVFSSED